MTPLLGTDHSPGTSCSKRWRPSGPVSRRGLLALGWHGMLLCTGLAAWPGWAQAGGDATAPPPEVRQRWPQARLQGQARFRYFGLHIYDAQLWVPPGFDAGRWPSQALALSLTYARRLKAASIAERSIDEMRRQARIGDEEARRWTQAMMAAWSDVRAGDRLTGVYQAPGTLSFYLNGQPTQAVADARFASLFVGIWLSPATSQPALREALLSLGTAVETTP